MSNSQSPASDDRLAWARKVAESARSWEHGALQWVSGSLGPCLAAMAPEELCQAIASASRVRISFGCEPPLPFFLWDLFVEGASHGHEVHLHSVQIPLDASKRAELARIAEGLPVLPLVFTDGLHVGYLDLEIPEKVRQFVGHALHELWVFPDLDQHTTVTFLSATGTLWKSAAELIRSTRSSEGLAIAFLPSTRDAGVVKDLLMRSGVPRGDILLVGGMTTPTALDLCVKAIGSTHILTLDPNLAGLLREHASALWKHGTPKGISVVIGCTVREKGTGLTRMTRSQWQAAMDFVGSCLPSNTDKAIFVMQDK